MERDQVRLVPASADRLPMHSEFHELLGCLSKRTSRRIQMAQSHLC